MAELEVRLSVNDGSTPIYRVTVNDGGFDGGTFTEITIGGYSGTMDLANVETAVRSFAAALGAVPGFTVVSITRVAVAETTL